MQAAAAAAAVAALPPPPNAPALPHLAHSHVCLRQRAAATSQVQSKDKAAALVYASPSGGEARCQAGQQGAGGPPWEALYHNLATPDCQRQCTGCQGIPGLPGAASGHASVLQAPRSAPRFVVTMKGARLGSRRKARGMNLLLSLRCAHAWHAALCGMGGAQAVAFDAASRLQGAHAQSIMLQQAPPCLLHALKRLGDITVTWAGLDVPTGA